MVVTIYTTKYTIENDVTKKREKKKEEKTQTNDMYLSKSVTCRLRKSSIYTLMKVSKLVRWLSDLINLSCRLAI